MHIRSVQAQSFCNMRRAALEKWMERNFHTNTFTGKSAEEGDRDEEKYTQTKVDGVPDY